MADDHRKRTEQHITTRGTDDDLLRPIGPIQLFLGWWFSNARAIRKHREIRAEEAALHEADARAREAFLRAENTPERVTEEFEIERYDRRRRLAEARIAAERAECAIKRLDDEDQLDRARINAEIDDIKIRAAKTHKKPTTVEERAREQAERATERARERALIDAIVREQMNQYYAELDEQVKRGALTEDEAEKRKAIYKQELLREYHAQES